MDILAVIIFSVLKYGGYVGYLSLLNRRLVIKKNIYTMAALRTLWGVLAAGVIYWFFHGHKETFLFLYVVLVFLGRFIAWGGLFRCYYKEMDRSQQRKAGWGGLAVSYLFDLPALIALWISIE